MVNHPRRSKKEQPAAPAIAEETIVSIKAFDANLQCRGFQYTIGASYEHAGKVVVCPTAEQAQRGDGGFHACEHPLDVLRYYPPATSRFAVVKQSGVLARHDEDTKIASAKITIEAEIQLSQLIERAVKWVFDRAKWSEGPNVSGPNEGATASGDSGAATASGDSGAATASGDSGAATASGDSGAATASGFRGAATASGAVVPRPLRAGCRDRFGRQWCRDRFGRQWCRDRFGRSECRDRFGRWCRDRFGRSWREWCRDRFGRQWCRDRFGRQWCRDRFGRTGGAATASGFRGAATASGSASGAATASGVRGAATASGVSGAATASGVSGCARGIDGCALFLVHRDDTCKITHAWAGIAGRDGIKPMTWYSLNKNGKPVEIE